MRRKLIFKNCMSTHQRRNQVKFLQNEAKQI